MGSPDAGPKAVPPGPPTIPPPRWSAIGVHLDTIVREAGVTVHPGGLDPARLDPGDRFSRGGPDGGRHGEHSDLTWREALGEVWKKVGITNRFFYGSRDEFLEDVARHWAHEAFTRWRAALAAGEVNSKSPVLDWFDGACGVAHTLIPKKDMEPYKLHMCDRRWLLQLHEEAREGAPR